MNPTGTATADLEAAARTLLARNGVVGEPHPMLLADTVRELEYHGIPADLEPFDGYRPGDRFYEAAVLEAAADEPAEDVWTVERGDYEVPCEHIACDTMHRHLYNADLPERTLIDLYNMAGDLIGSRWETRTHVKTVRQWVVLCNGERRGDAHDTKRDALAQADQRPTY